MRFMTFIILLLILNSFSNDATSATKVKSQEINEEILLDKNKGFILFGLETSRDLKSIHLSGPTNIILTSEDIKSGSHYLLVDLQVGVYTIKKIRFDRRWYIKFKDAKNWNFHIQPGVINYVGHLELVQNGYFASSGTRVELVNRSTEALQFLQQQYPTQLKRNPVEYNGPGEDKFFDFLYNKMMVTK